MSKKKKDELESISDILGGLDKQSDLGKALEQARVLSAWDEIAGDLAAHGKPHSLKKGRLKIEAESSVWAHRFSYQKRVMKKQINKLAGKRLVKEIFVMLQGEEFKEEGPPGDQAENTSS